ncbi:hypothetical protein ACLB2K_001846 [Fragaria x ananassa]
MAMNGGGGREWCYEVRDEESEGRGKHRWVKRGSCRAGEVSKSVTQRRRRRRRRRKVTADDGLKENGPREKDLLCEGENLTWQPLCENLLVLPSDFT